MQEQAAGPWVRRASQSLCNGGSCAPRSEPFHVMDGENEWSPKLPAALEGTLGKSPGAHTDPASGEAPKWDAVSASCSFSERAPTSERYLTSKSRYRRSWRRVSTADCHDDLHGSLPATRSPTRTPVRQRRLVGAMQVMPPHWSDVRLVPNPIPPSARDSCAGSALDRGVGSARQCGRTSSPDGEARRGARPHLAQRRCRLHLGRTRVAVSARIRQGWLPSLPDLGTGRPHNAEVGRCQWGSTRFGQAARTTS